MVKVKQPADQLTQFARYIYISRDSKYRTYKFVDDDNRKLEALKGERKEVVLIFDPRLGQVTYS